MPRNDFLKHVENCRIAREKILFVMKILKNAHVSVIELDLFKFRSNVLAPIKRTKAPKNVKLTSSNYALHTKVVS